MSAPSDAELLTRLRAGDREAYAVLVARHYGLVLTACRRQAAPGEEDDCAQAVFLILARKPAAAARVPVLAAWLLRVAWFVCRNSRRVAQRRRQAERAAATTAPPPPRPEALDHLDDCLVKLPERQRAAIALHFLSGQTAEEVAAQLGTSRDNAYQLISRGLNALRELLARRGVVMAGAGLASVLAAEAEAASAPVSTAVLAGLSATPSTTVATLSTGAMHAMTIAALAPVTAAAGLLLAVGTTAVLLAAEPAPVPVPAPVPAPEVASMPAEAAPAPVPVPVPDNLSGQWTDVDSRVVAQGLAQKILADPWLAQFTTDKQRMPKLVFGRFVVRLESGLSVQTQPIIDAIERDLLASKKVQILVAPVEERRIVEEGKPAAPAAEALPMDVLVTGSLSMSADQQGRSSVKHFTVTLKGIDPATQQLLFSVEERIRKEIVQTRWK